MVDNKLQLDWPEIELGSEAKDKNLLVSRIGIAVVSEIGPNALEAERCRAEAAIKAAEANREAAQVQAESNRQAALAQAEAQRQAAVVPARHATWRHLATAAVVSGCGGMVYAKPEIGWPLAALAAVLGGIAVADQIFKKMPK